ncbi:MAG: bacillithiol biosynthesis deacetylase BshB1 [candidate division Zixibacteria bacterium]|nr:bacillithiol biosynthesis deacetylase BshB1 [candidate division Zixibacteria bacterium]
MKLDLLAFAPHPDDVELHCGGLMLKMAHRGHATGIADLTRGETGTRGTPEDRAREAQTAGRILGLSARENLGLPDAHIASTHENRLAVVRVIRTYCPKIVLIPHEVARHPDHTAASQLVRDAVFLAGLTRIETGQPPYRPRQTIFYFTHLGFRDLVPSFIVDIGGFMERKLNAIRAYTTQFYNPDSTEPLTYISRPEFLDELEAQTRYFGSLIGVRYGEPFAVREFLTIDDPVVYFEG